MKRLTRFSGTNFILGAIPAGFGLQFYVDDSGIISATHVFDVSKQGAPGILHGGAIAAVLDEAMGAAAYEAGFPGYTVTMTYNYRSHIPLGQPIELAAWVDRVENERKIYALCSATLPDGTIAVEGSGLFIYSAELKQALDTWSAGNQL